MQASTQGQGEVASAPSGGSTRSYGLDAIRGLAVFAVLVQHTVDSSLQNDFFRPVWLDQAVPIFILLYAYNAAVSYGRSGVRSLRDLYSEAYVRSRVRRLLVPALVAFAIMVVGGFVLGTFRFNFLVLVGSGPLDTGAPGDYFILLILSLAVVFPAVWWCYARAPVPTLVALVLLAALQELFIGAFAPRSAFGQYVAVANPVRMGAVLAAGIWLARVGGPREALRRYLRPMVALALPSLVFLMAVKIAKDRAGYDAFGVLFPSFNVSTGVWAAGWTLLLTVCGTVGLDRLHAWARGPVLVALGVLALVGQAAYEMFLSQEVIIGLSTPATAIGRVVAVIASLIVGWLAWRATRGGPRPPTAARAPV